MNKESMGESCLFSYQFEIRVVDGATMCHSKNKHYKNEREINYICLKYS